MQLPTRSSLKPQVQERITRLNRWYQKPIAQVSTALLLTVVTITFFAVVAIRPTLSTIAQLVRKIEDQRQVKAQLDQKVAALATAESELALIRPQLTNLAQAVPNTTELDVILKQTEASANSVPVNLTDLNFTQVTLGPEIDNEETTGAIPIPFSAGLASDFTNLTNFLNTITINKRLITISSIDFTPTTQENQESQSQINLTIGLNAYYYPN